MASFGETLRRERELREISLREISESTKINLRYLDALERDDFRHLPGGVFNKGFVRAFSEYIGIDAEKMVTAYLDEERHQRERDRQVADARHQLIGTASPVGHPTTSRPSAPSRRVWLAAGVGGTLVVVTAAVAAVFLWGRIGGNDDALGKTPPTQDPVPSAGAASGAIGSGALPSGSTQREDGAATPSEAIRPTRLVLARETSGRAWCEGGAVSTLDGLSAGSTLEFPCGESLIVEAADAGAILVVAGGTPPRPLGPDGTRASGRVASAIGSASEGPR